MNEENEMQELESDVRRAVLVALAELAEKQELPLHQIQPPTSVLQAAANAATQVFMAFERGYLMGD